MEFFILTGKKTNMSVNHAKYTDNKKIIQSTHTLSDNNHPSVITPCSIPVENSNLYEATSSRLTSRAIF